MGSSLPFPTESGLSECARYSTATGCEGLNSGLALLAIGIPALLVSVLLAASATAGISRASHDRKALWLAIVWCVPVAGAVTWFITGLFARDLRTARDVSSNSRHATSAAASEARTPDATTSQPAPAAGGVAESERERG
jgi:hypothetical protein